MFLNKACHIIKTDYIRLNIIRRFTKLAYVSDLHLEHKRWRTQFPKINKEQLQKLDSSVNGIAILGDLSNPGYDNFYNFLSYCGSIFKNVYFVAGNHEYYIKGFDDKNLSTYVYEKILKSVEKAKSLSGNSNIHFLNNSVIELPNHKILIGSTLWSDHSKSFETANDTFLNIYKCINREHLLAKTYIRDQLDVCKKYNFIHSVKNPNVTILTHYLPTYHLIDEKYRHGYTPAVSERYYSRQEHLIRFPVKNWICGHSHSVINTHLNGVYLGINSYVSQNSYEINLKFVNL